MELIAALLADGELADYHLAHAALADMLRRAGQHLAAYEAYGQALALCRMQPERRFLEKRMAEMAREAGLSG